MKRFFYILSIIAVYSFLSGCNRDSGSASTYPGALKADAGADRIVSVSGQVTLDGSGSRAPEGEELTFLWAMTDKPDESAAELSGAATATPHFIADRAGGFVISLTVSGSGDPEVAATDSVTVTAVDDMYPDMRYISGGSFYMGTDSGNTDEAPVHLVYLDAFFMDITEVSVAEYKECVDAQICLPPYKRSSLTREDYFDNGDYSDYPVVNVTHEDAKTYCEYAGKALPTEAMWEKAARGEARYLYPWGNEIISGAANYDDLTGDTSEAGSYPQGASLYGMYDMAGNAAEWTADYYDDYYYSNSPYENPQGPVAGDFYVTRGGNFSSDQLDIRTVSRSYFSLEAASDYIGFRCALSPMQ